MKKWSVAFVNYKTCIYLKWQLKILYEFNDPNDFEVIIVDNSSPYEKDELNAITCDYQSSWNNVKIIYHVVQQKRASCQHAEGLTAAIQVAEGEYFLAQDPDFFFVKRDYLSFLAQFLKQGKVAVGAPYTNGVGLGNPRFPALFGCAIPLNLIKNIDLMPNIGQETWEDHDKRFKGMNFSYDVGYQVRKILSSPDRDDNFVAFDCDDFKDLSIEIGFHTYNMETQAYSYQGERIAYHLFGGAYTSRPIDDADPNRPIAPDILAIRDNMSKWFYGQIRSSGEMAKTKSWHSKIRNFYRKWIFRIGRFDNIDHIVFFNLIRIKHRVKKVNPPNL
ncbi:MAG: glycosyltransferase [Bacteriovoracaceae bacterium]|nr:glycosyltransferase [Bacteriovoracaceae bacterium]